MLKHVMVEYIEECRYSKKIFRAIIGMYRKRTKYNLENGKNICYY